MIAKPKTYPTIDWLDFVAACNKWGILTDKSLTQQDIDRIFIATNFEEEDLEENDDSSLCRYEYFEILVRIAKTKYVENGSMTSISEACEKLISTFIIPNSIETLSWQEFREHKLWALEIDDIIK